MAATADPRAKPPSAHHMKPWAPTPTRRAHRVPSLPAVSGGGGGARVGRDRRRSSSSHRRGGTATDAGVVEEEEEAHGGRLEDLRAKLMGHLKDAADRLRLPQPKSKPRSPEPEPPKAPLPLPPPPPPPPPQDTSAAAITRPWNLRERKGRSSGRGSTSASPPTPWAREAETARSGERAPFSLALGAEEIEEDIYALTGGRPRRRPRKRPRVVQRLLDSLFPGLWLTEITADAYKVPDD
ncbi:hypothetical protein GUJ93_ZPchr0007g4329 [Zizania palustris]|uniref:DUF1639 family protein n=1 Tax=Zizania palustris TaxID=103762 RepID=A0A8J5SPM5_ZIZPA|nr:hypothetical protein GUJ93_ZPchr0007g4329 [Zizania palustris]